MPFKKKELSEVSVEKEFQLNSDKIVSELEIELDSSEEVLPVDNNKVTMNVIEKYLEMNQYIEKRINNVILPFITKNVFGREKGFVFNYKFISNNYVRIHFKDYLKEVCKEKGELTVEIPNKLFCDYNNDSLFAFLNELSNYKIN